jgi:hypothetical protein
VSGYKNKEDRDRHNHYYFKLWYERNGKTRNRNSDYVEKIKEWQNLNREKVIASRELAKAIQKGIIKKPINCQGCNRQTKLSGHHTDYTKPLIVIWLCSSCHKLKHSQYALLTNGTLET